MRYLILSILSICSIGCQKSQLDPSFFFRKVSPEASRVFFNNEITETDQFNALDYEYLYNGGGVGVADFDLDGLPDLFFSGNMQSSRLYLNQGDWQFQDMTQSAGVETSNWCTGISIVDINQDGYPDIHLSSVHGADFKQTRNLFFINTTPQKGFISFLDQATEMGLSDTSYTMQVVWLDYDLDGDLDAFQANNSIETYPRNTPFGQAQDGSGKSTDRLYRNDGIQANGLPRFTDVSKMAGIQIEGWSLGVKVLDINRDGYPDIYVANDFMSNDILYVNNQNGTYSNQITEYFSHQSHNSMGIDVADLNNDEAIDLVILDMLPEDNLRQKTMFDQIPFDRFEQSLRKNYQPQFIRNVLQANNGQGHFSDIGYYAGIAATDWSWSPLLADFNNDGRRDIYITNGYKKDVTDLDFVNYNNTASVFGTAEEKYALLKQQLEQMQGIKKSNRFFVNQGQFLFDDRTSEVGLHIPSYSNGAIYADIDRDGDLDIVVNNINEPALLLENKLTKPANFIRFKLGPDAQAYGAKIWLYTQTSNQFAEYYPQLGYLSSVEPVIHFGLDTIHTIDSLKIKWPNGLIQREYNLSANQTLEYTAPMLPKDSVPSLQMPINHPKETYLKEMHIIDYAHQEKPFDDFKKWPLRFRGHSNNGPTLATGDINGDGLEDLFIGGSAKQNGQFQLQTPEGTFIRYQLSDEAGMLSEDVDALLFDADQDGDLDLYCVSGSAEHFSKPQFYQDRYYENDGRGNFYLKEEVLPQINSAGGCIVAFDFDQDGDLDLFRGGRITPNHYPNTPQSYLLENKGGSFEEVRSPLSQAGMVTDAVATDIDSDGWVDLILAGEWMPIQVYYNKQGSLLRDESGNGLNQTHGWWNCLVSADFDQDGDMDFIAGNWGLNNPFRASIHQPVSIYAKDYDANGTQEAIFTYFNQGKEYIFHPRGTLTSQLPGLKNIFTDYRSYGQATFPKTFESFAFKANEIFRTYELASIYIENKGNRQFAYQKLPPSTQWSPITAALITDINQDQHLDVLAVGNYHQSEILSGWYDAGVGYCLLGQGDGTFEVSLGSETGFLVPEYAQSLQQLGYKKGSNLFVVGVQNGKLKIFER